MPRPSVLRRYGRANDGESADSLMEAIRMAYRRVQRRDGVICISGQLCGQVFRRLVKLITGRSCRHPYLNKTRSSTCRRSLAAPATFASEAARVSGFESAGLVDLVARNDVRGLCRKHLPPR